MSSIMIFIFIIYIIYIFNTTNNGEKLYITSAVIRKETNACATFKYEYLILHEPYQHQPFCNLHFF